MLTGDLLQDMPTDLKTKGQLIEGQGRKQGSQDEVEQQGGGPRKG